MRVRQTLILVTTLIAIGVGFWMMQRFDSAEEASTVSAAPSIRGITLINDDGREFRLDAGGGKWMILFFGYASCPDVCPMSLAYLNRELTTAGPAADAFQSVFVSVDPERDRPEVLKRYVAAFSSRIVGATGTTDMLEKLSKQLGVYYEIERSGEGDSYTIVHSGAFFVIDPHGKLVKTLSPPQAPGALSAIITQLSDQRKV